MNKLIVTIVLVSAFGLAMVGCTKDETAGVDKTTPRQTEANATPQDKAKSGGAAIPDFELDGK